MNMNIDKAINGIIDYCKEWGETPRSRSAVTDLFNKKMKIVSKRRADGIWYYMETRPVEEEKEDLPAPVQEDMPEDNEAELPF